MPVVGVPIKSTVEGARLNVAVTVVLAVIVIGQVPVPAHPPPDHPARGEHDEYVGVNVTAVFSLYVSVQSLPQSMPAGELVIVPVPVPAFRMVRVNCFCPKPDTGTFTSDN
jgi:hypothetical protein